MIITIDGPTASGKSTLARAVAQKLGFYYVYSGLLFRALAYILMRDKGYTLASIAHPHAADVDYALDPAFFSYSYSDGKEHILFHEENITSLLKTNDIDAAASIISTDPSVRQCILEVQRAVAREHSVVADGRDAGSVVFPHAEYKFFVTASLSERARRWILDQAKQGRTFTPEQAQEQLEERDHRDSTRVHAPLIIPAGAQIIDTTTLSKDEALAAIINQITTPHN
jgi:cytidylate kinase